jgi:hypothetical protein
METLAAQARAIDGDRDTVEMSTLANGLALYHLGEGQLPEALDAMDRAMDVLRAVGGAHDFPGRWALLRTVTDAGGAQARDECRRLSFDTAMSRAALTAADAVAVGREGGDAASIFAAADRALGRIESGFTRSLARLLAAPCAYRDGWGEPAVWLREALSPAPERGAASNRPAGCPRRHATGGRGAGPDRRRALQPGDSRGVAPVSPHRGKARGTASHEDRSQPL